jgi:hypothetical protein
MPRKKEWAEGGGSNVGDLGNGRMHALEHVEEVASWEFTREDSDWIRMGEHSLGVSCTASVVAQSWTWAKSVRETRYKSCSAETKDAGRSQVWWFRTVIPALGRWSQEDVEFQATQ